MPIELKMPALSPTMEEGTLAKWLVKEGDDVRSGDILAEIETDKATMEFEAVDEGKIAKILVPEGTDGVKVGQPIALLAGEGEQVSDAAPAAAPAAAPEPDQTQELRRASKFPPRSRTSPHPRRMSSKPPRAISSPTSQIPMTSPRSRKARHLSRPRCARRCATRWPRRCGLTSACS